MKRAFVLAVCVVSILRSAQITLDQIAAVHSIFDTLNINHHFHLKRNYSVISKLVFTCENPLSTGNFAGFDKKYAEIAKTVENSRFLEPL